MDKALDLSPEQLWQSVMDFIVPAGHHIAEYQAKKDKATAAALALYNMARRAPSLRGEPAQVPPLESQSNVGTPSHSGAINPSFYTPPMDLLREFFHKGDIGGLSRTSWDRARDAFRKLDSRERIAAPSPSDVAQRKAVEYLEAIFGKREDTEPAVFEFLDDSADAQDQGFTKWAAGKALAALRSLRSRLSTPLAPTVESTQERWAFARGIRSMIPRVNFGSDYTELDVLRVINEEWESDRKLRARCGNTPVQKLESAERGEPCDPSKFPEFPKVGAGAASLGAGTGEPREWTLRGWPNCVDWPAATSGPTLQSHERIKVREIITPQASPPVPWAIPYPDEPGRWMCSHCSVDLFPLSYACPNPGYVRPQASQTPAPGGEG